MANTKKEFLVKLIQNPDNEGIIDVFEDFVESRLFAQKVAERTGLMPVRVAFEVHTSQQGNRYRTGIKKAFSGKKGLANDRVTIEQVLIEP